MNTWFLGLTVLVLVQDVTFGCQPQVCRRRRAIFENKVTLQLDGCTGKSPPWIRQVAYCLNLSVTTMTLGIKSWYKETYNMCREKGCQEYVSNRENKNIPDCVKCWEEEIRNPESAEIFGVLTQVSTDNITECVNGSIYAFLNNDLPQLDMETRYKGSIDLADVRPSEYWWSVKVELPCKPKVFAYWNANCINSFAKDLKEGDYVLVQNKLISKDRITFYVEFSETCSFEPEKINIIWDESTPAPGLVQTSSFPSQFPPKRDEAVSIFYDLDAARRLLLVDDNDVPEYKIAKEAFDNKRRKKRQAENPNYGRIGVKFPCGVSSFKVSDSDANLPYDITGASDKFLIDSSDALRNGVRTSLMNFTLDYGYQKTGCVFNSAEIKVLPNPPIDWFRNHNEQMSCLTCVNRRNDRDCTDRGQKKVCDKGEVCQTEVRHIAKGFRLITKDCKQKTACALNSLKKKKSAQCRPGKPGSVCRCCCNTYMCNDGNSKSCSMRQ